MIKPTAHYDIRQATTILLAILLAGPLAAARAQAPGDDFFAYANGAWLKSATIPAGRERWGARDEMNEVNRKRMAMLFDGVATAPAGSTARKVADFRAAWLNEAAIEAKGIAPLRPGLDSIDRVRDKSALTQLLGRGVRTDVDPLNWGVYRSAHILGLSVEEGIHGEKRPVAYLLQGGLGLPDREYYLSAEPRMQAVRIKYLVYVAQLLTLAGFDHAQQRAAAVMTLETAIAETQGSREATANDRNADHLWTRADFARQAPGMDWAAFFAAAGLSKQDAFVAWQPSAVSGVAALVASQPLDAWQDYLRFHLIDDNADVLPRAFAEAALAMRGAADQPQPALREQRARDATQLALSDAIGKIYADRYFPAEQKRRVQLIAANVAAEFTKRVESATWMSPATRALALAKLKLLYVGVAYPDHWEDYADLRVDPLDAFGNVTRVAARDYRRSLARLGQPLDIAEWRIAPQTVGGVLVFQQHAYDLPAALLQAPKFDATASDAASYGAIGAIIAHDISHYVDRLGADYDTAGAMQHWWTAKDSARFEAMAEPLVRQFSEYQPLPGTRVDGKLTETENLGDLAGLVSAFDAYRRTLGDRMQDKSFVHQQDREFFIAFAQSYRVKFSDNGIRTQLANDHAPEMYRVATVRNLDAWYDAFDVQPGQRLYLAPNARVRVW